MLQGMDLEVGRLSWTRRAARLIAQVLESRGESLPGEKRSQKDNLPLLAEDEAGPGQGTQRPLEANKGL